MSANVLIVDMRPIITRWFNFSESQANDLDIHFALKDLLIHTGHNMVDQESEVDVLGASMFLQNSGWDSNVLQTMINEVATTIRAIYLNQTTPEWRNGGVKQIQIDRHYLMTVRLGIDPYV